MDAGYLPTSEYSRAMQTLRAGKSVFWWLILVSVLAQVAAFCAVVFFGTLDPMHRPVVVALPAEGPAESAMDKAAEAIDAVAQIVQPDAPSGLPTTQEELPQATTYHFALRWALAATKFLAFASGLILVVVVLYHLQVSLIGRLGGAAGFARAMMWSLVLLALLTPWQQVFDRSLVVGALYNLADLETGTKTVRAEWGAPQPSMWLQIVYFTRFLAYPIVTILVGIMVHSRLRQAYSAMVLPVESKP